MYVDPRHKTQRAIQFFFVVTSTTDTRKTHARHTQDTRKTDVVPILSDSSWKPSVAWVADSGIGMMTGSISPSFT